MIHIYSLEPFDLHLEAAEDGVVLHIPAKLLLGVEVAAASCSVLLVDVLDGLTTAQPNLSVRR
jgi:hypothetical protein